jgi:hypothetical protein
VTDSARVAVLLDCDNVSHTWARAVLGEAAKHGTLGIKRGYGDWASESLKNWRPQLSAHAIQPVQQFAYTTGKNSTDFALVIDAMDLLYSENVDVFCIVSSDSDFTRLAMRLRESGKRVYGIGARKTPSAFQNACDRFTYLEVLDGAPAEVAAAQATGAAKAVAPKKRQPAAKAPAKKATKKAAAEPKTSKMSPAQLEEITSHLLPAIVANARDDGWAILGGVGSYVVNTDPTFDSRNYGYSKLSDLVRDVPSLEVREVPSGNGQVVLHVRRAPTARSRR